MIIDVVGAGSLGLLYGGKLQTSGISVRFWTRTSVQAGQLKQEGMTIMEKDREIHIRPDEIQAYPASQLANVWNEKPGDWILLTVKQTHIDDFIEQTATLTVESRQSLKIACYQNGLGHLEKLQAAFSNAWLCSAITTEGAKRTGGKVCRAGYAETLLGVSKRSTKANAEIVDEQQIFTLAKVMQQAGFDCTVSNEIDKPIYRKLLINAVINPLTAIWRIPNGELLHKKERISIMRQLCDEAMNVYKAMNVQLEGDMWDQIQGVCRGTASNTSSMLADVLHKRTTEVESINGSIIRMAKEFNLKVPTHEMLFHLIQGMQSEGVS
ncbi:2-dehydropantoate 2-reductase [Paenibacillus polysaccharolyticus]|uniref:ketopantoate reductase family protein n=1 Tax=Paenibacillus polysaccharolyticus TaxID=582692 RepID=UPI00203D389B|nr:2-dehydropantoate 2-reductase [Paenibacillus polysaccharolyticus]MCM3133837.1 2-dehydropantoate 2-reductase [Paenibacillus polysaccharolyticus]